MEQVNIGIIGGSGLYQMPELQNIREIALIRRSATRRTLLSSANWRA
jgi:purine nucleoside phosphorylase